MPPLFAESSLLDCDKAKSERCSNDGEVYPSSWLGTRWDCFNPRFLGLKFLCWNPNEPPMRHTADIRTATKYMVIACGLWTWSDIQSMQTGVARKLLSCCHCHSDCHGSVVSSDAWNTYVRSVKTRTRQMGSRTYSSMEIRDPRAGSSIISDPAESFLSLCFLVWIEVQVECRHSTFKLERCFTVTSS